MALRLERFFPAAQTVTVQDGEETIVELTLASVVEHKALVEKRGDLRTAGWFIAVGSAVVLGSGIAMLAATRSSGDIRDNEYAEYLAADSTANADDAYNGVRSSVDMHNNLIYAGGAFLGVALASAAVSFFLFWLAPEVQEMPAAVAPTDGGAVLTLGGGF